jgi:hypothetical protein
MVKSRRFKRSKKSKKHLHHKRHKRHSTHRRKVKRHSRRRRTKRVKKVLGRGAGEEYGMSPARAVGGRGESAYAVHAFNAEHKGEMSLVEGDEIIVTAMHVNGWWTGYKEDVDGSRVEGLFPGNYMVLRGRG